MSQSPDREKGYHCKFSLNSSSVGLPCSTPANDGSSEPNEDTTAAGHEAIVSAAGSDSGAGGGAGIEDRICGGYVGQSDFKTICSERIKRGDVSKLNSELNEFYAKRIREIDDCANGDADLKADTYKEWAEMLMSINKTIIKNMEEFESEVGKRLGLLHQRAKETKSLPPSPEFDEKQSTKYRRDICALLKVIHNGYHYDNWNLQGIPFETMTPAQVLGVSEECYGNCLSTGGDHRQLRQSQADEASSRRNKMIANMRALALEVAEKHDEICELKKQILCFESEIQKAQQKIQLKDVVIKELRNNLKRDDNTKFTNFYGNSTRSSLDGANMEEERPQITDQPSQSSESSAERQQGGDSTATETSENVFVSADVNDDFENLNPTKSDEEEENKLKELQAELDDFLVTNADIRQQNLDRQRQRLSEIFEKLTTDKYAAYRKLHFIRRQLLDLDMYGGYPSNKPSKPCESDCLSDSGEYLQDMKIIDSIRKRMISLNESFLKLQSRLKSCEIYGKDMALKMAAEKQLAQKNNEILKQVADVISEINSEGVQYCCMFEEDNTENPLCDAIIAMDKKSAEKINELTSTIQKQQLEIMELKKQNAEIEEAAKAKKTTHPPTQQTQQQHNHSSHPINDSKREGASS